MLYSPQDNQGGTKDWKAGADKTTQPTDPTQNVPGKELPGQPSTPQDNDPAKIDVTKGQANTDPLGAK